MAETGGIFIIDGEDAGTTPWEFDSINEDLSSTFALAGAAANNGSNGYEATFDGVDITCHGVFGFAQQSEIFIRFYLFVPTGFTIGSTSGRYTTIFDLGDGGFVGATIRIRTTTGGVVNQIGGSYRTEAFTFESTFFSVNAWHYIEVRFLNDAFNGGMEWWVDGNLISQDLDQDTSSRFMDGFRIGGISSNDQPGANDSFYIDDIKADTSQVGAFPPAGTAATIVPILDHHNRMMAMMGD